MSLVECDFPQAAPKPKALWTGGEVHEAITPPVIWDGYVYGFWIDKREEAWALEGKPGYADFSLRYSDLATGKLQWSKPGFRMGLSIVAAEGLLYVRNHQPLTLVEANPKAYAVKGRIANVRNFKNTSPRSQKGLLDWNTQVISRGGCSSALPPR